MLASKTRVTDDNVYLDTITNETLWSPPIRENLRVRNGILYDDAANSLYPDYSFVHIFMMQ